MLIDFRERGERWVGGERETERKQVRCERETLIGCLTGDGTQSLLVYGMVLQSTEPPG